MKEIIDALREFRDERNWSRFHNPKDLSLALSIEAAELNELFLWKTGEDDWKNMDIGEISEELADVFAFAFLLAEKYDLDVKKIVLDKISKNRQKYPVDKSYNRATKYNKL